MVFGVFFVGGVDEEDVLFVIRIVLYLGFDKFLKYFIIDVWCLGEFLVELDFVFWLDSFSVKLFLLVFGDGIESNKLVWELLVWWFIFIFFIRFLFWLV